MEFSQEQQHLKDEEDKKAVVLDAVRSKCTTSSEYAIMREMAQTMEKSEGNLDGELVSGGKTNYSFKIFVDTNRSKAVYAKIFLPHALWDEDRHFQFDTLRAVSEYDIMSKLSSSSDEAVCKVATPLFVLDVSGNAKVLVAEWAEGTEEQWGNQFLDGHVDSRVVTKVAQAMAQLNLQEIDYDWNEAVRPGLQSINPIIKSVYVKLTSTSDFECDRVMKELKEVGQDQFDQIVDSYCSQLQEQRQVLCHNDCHPFNILVEPKPMGEGTEGDGEEDELDLTSGTAESGTTSELFGPNGDYLICDWETAICGPAGKDAGIFMAFPSACTLCLAVQGYTAESFHLLDCALDFWTTYSKAISTSDRKTEAHNLPNLCRVALGTLGANLLFNLYMLGVLADTLPLNGVSEPDAKRVRSSIGLVGLKLLLLAFGKDDNPIQIEVEGEEAAPTTDTVEGLIAYYKSAISQHIEILSESTTNMGNKLRRAKSSFLRSIRRRVSDSSGFEEATSRISTHNLDWSDHKRVAAFDSSDLGASVDLGASMASFIDDNFLDDDDFEVTDEMRRQWEADLAD